MILVGKLFRVLRRPVRRVSWSMVALALLAHTGLSWVLLWLAGEHTLVGLDAFAWITAGSLPISANAAHCCWACARPMAHCA
ncbi:potassium channel-like protein [Xanthomonas bromi]|uniref:Potassium channel-like protein n=1 Tax=Xanthomonas bromi TaxID=56449 RepID=A0A1C3NRA2_9XANT|nr:hypothetical protein [Xanthomonas bromi]SBV52919.1 potassium channel-like protein [Xanthomonas bromi]